MGKRIKSWKDITVRAFVQGANGELIDVDTLTEAQKVDVATRLKCGWLNGMFDGKAVFTPEKTREGEQYETQNTAPAPEKTKRACQAGSLPDRGRSGGNHLCNTGAE